MVSVGHAEFWQAPLLWSVSDEIFRLKKGSAAYQAPPARPYLNYIRFSSVSFSFSSLCIYLQSPEGEVTRPALRDNSTDLHSNSLDYTNIQQFLTFMLLRCTCHHHDDADLQLKRLTEMFTCVLPQVFN